MSKIVVTNIKNEQSAATVLPIDRVMFERQFGKSVGALAKEEREEFFLWLAWHAFKRESVTALEFDGWLATVADWTVEDDALPPSDPAASPTP
jgi:hypothetical protein